MKKLLNVILILLLVLVIGSVSSLATELNADDDNEAESGTVKIGSSSNTNKSSSNTNKASSNTNTNKISGDNTVEGNAVGATNSNISTNKTNTSNYNSTTGSASSSSNSSKLPYAGTSTTSVVLIAIAFVGSAVYAYKKVTDYNI